MTDLPPEAINAAAEELAIRLGDDAGGWRPTAAAVLKAAEPYIATAERERVRRLVIDTCARLIAGLKP
jgi:hypothetical protein